MDGVLADFKYDLSMSTSAVSFDYSYSVDAQIFVVDRETGDPLYSPTYEITPEKKTAVSTCLKSVSPKYWCSVL